MTQHTPPTVSKPKWHVIDARGQRLGRLASSVAGILQGKQRPDYSRHQLSGDFVVVLNATEVDLSGKKLNQKRYYRHTGYTGHLREIPLERMLEKHPERVVEKAVKGMLPRNRLGRRMLGRLRVYSGPTHPHEAQVNAGTGKPKEARPEQVKEPPAAQKAAAAAPEKQPAPKAAPKKPKAAAAAPPKAEAAASKPKAGAAKAPTRRRAQPAAEAAPEAPASEQPASEESAAQEEKEE